MLNLFFSRDDLEKAPQYHDIELKYSKYHNLKKMALDNRERRRVALTYKLSKCNIINLKTIKT